MRAGYGRFSITPAESFPLAGEVTLGERMAREVADPLHATCILLRDGHTNTAIVSVDLLIIERSLYEELSGIANQLGIQNLYISATHTHSSFGGYLSRDGASLFMGRRRPALRAKLVRGVREAMKEALDDLKPVTELSWGSAGVPGLTMNRRERLGPKDDTVRFVQMSREAGPPVMVLSTSGHPVVMMVRRPNAASADYPGKLVETLARNGVKALFLIGAVGACNILFPEMDGGAEDHLALLENLILGGLEQAMERGQRLDGSKASAKFMWAPVKVTAQPSPILPWRDKEAMLSAVWSAVGRAFFRSLKERATEVQLPIVKLGGAILVGMPADYSVWAQQRVVETVDALGGMAIVSSHTNDFIGYMHPRTQYERNSEHNKQFFHYENAMTWYGKGVADDLADKAIESAAILLPAGDLPN